MSNAEPEVKSGHGVAVVVDAEVSFCSKLLSFRLVPCLVSASCPVLHCVCGGKITSYLMMGALGAGLKRHSVSLFEGTTVSCTVLQQFRLSLGCISLLSRAKHGLQADV